MTAVREPMPDFLVDPEPRDVTYTLVSVDDHVVEPAHTFEGRLPRDLADRAPRIVELDVGVEISREHQNLPSIVAHKPGREVWVYEDKVFAQVGLNAVAGYKDYADLRFEPTSFAEMRPGCYDATARVRDMDLAGIWSSLNFPSSIAGFCGSVLSASDDPVLGQAVTRAWNDWIFEEWYSAYPERFIPLGLTWLADPEVGAAEVRRNADRGFRAVTLPELPHWLGYPEVHSGYWDPVLHACEETGTVVCLHVGSSGMLPQPFSGPRFEKNITLFPAVSLISATEWLWSGVLQRFPTLQIAMSEGGIGWVPMLLDRLEYVMDHSGAGRPGLARRPHPGRDAAAELLVLHARRPVDPPGHRPHRHRPRDAGSGLPPLRLHLARLAAAAPRAVRGQWALRRPRRRPHLPERVDALPQPAPRRRRLTDRRPATQVSSGPREP